MSIKKILVVDDDYDFRLQTSTYLKNLGFQVIEAENDFMAAQIIKEGGYDLAVLDLMIDHEDSGFTLAHKIKKSNPNTPVIIVTSATRETGFTFSEPNKADKSWIRADAVLDKALRFEQLENEIQKLLQ